MTRLLGVLAVDAAPAGTHPTTTGATPPPTNASTPPRTARTPSSFNGGPSPTSWQQAEALAVWHLRLLGFADARRTGAGADAGADVLATGAVAQVKHWTEPVGQPPLRDLFGVAQAAAAKPFFYSLAGYTAPALEWANGTNMALFTYTLAGNVVALNSAAHVLAPRSTSGGKPLGMLERRRADRYRRELDKLRSEINELTGLMHKRTQSRRASVRGKAGMAAELLSRASRALDGGDVLPPADRRREDFHKAVRDTLQAVRRIL
ncbi:restriction endonuclease [Dactylosporangium sp. CA-052675]|uniref:restriction endonuclease n=1 Tax=Dactylosporangium sp. CA-052675 TaxID=3239927 RepID=UPI003D91D47A